MSDAEFAGGSLRAAMPANLSAVPLVKFADGEHFIVRLEVVVDGYHCHSRRRQYCQGSQEIREGRVLAARSVLRKAAVDAVNP